jgi:hypothetical protein
MQRVYYGAYLTQNYQNAIKMWMIIWQKLEGIKYKQLI